MQSVVNFQYWLKFISDIKNTVSENYDRFSENMFMFLTISHQQYWFMVHAATSTIRIAEVGTQYQQMKLFVVVVICETGFEFVNAAVALSYSSLNISVYQNQFNIKRFKNKTPNPEGPSKFLFSKRLNFSCVCVWMLVHDSIYFDSTFKFHIHVIYAI